MGAYVLGEFGFLIAEEPGRSGEAQFALLASHFPACSTATQYQMLSAYAKIANLYEECRPLAAAVFERCGGALLTSSSSSSSSFSSSVVFSASF